MNTRAATTADSDAIILLDHVTKIDPTRVEFILSKIASSSCYVAVDTEKLLAYAVFNYNFYDNGWIEMLYVDAEFRRQGIGSSLIRDLFNVCKTTKLFTSTNQSNLPMQRLLETLGFSLSGVIANLDEDDPELVFFKLLSSKST